MLGHLKLTELLIKNGVNVNSKDNEGNTALHKAGMSFFLFFKKKSSDFDSFTTQIMLMSLNSSSNTAQPMSMLSIKTEIVHFTSQYVSVRDCVNCYIEKRTTLDFELISIPGKFNIFGGRRKIDYFNTVRILIENGANINIRNKHGESPLSMSKK